MRGINQWEYWSDRWNAVRNSGSGSFLVSCHKSMSLICEHSKINTLSGLCYDCIGDWFSTVSQVKGVWIRAPSVTSGWCTGGDTAGGDLWPGKKAPIRSFSQGKGERLDRETEPVRKETKRQTAGLTQNQLPNRWSQRWMISGSFGSVIRRFQLNQV